MCFPGTGCAMTWPTDVRSCPTCGEGIFEQTTIGSLLPGPDPNIATCSNKHRWWIRDGSAYEPRAHVEGIIIPGEKS